MPLYVLCVRVCESTVYFVVVTYLPGYCREVLLLFWLLAITVHPNVNVRFVGKWTLHLLCHFETSLFVKFLNADPDTLVVWLGGSLVAHIS